MSTEIKTILKLSVPLIVQVGQIKTSLEEVLSLGPGAIVELNRSSDSKLDMLVNNKLIGHGTAVKVGENFGIKITSIGSAKQRIEALGSH